MSNTSKAIFYKIRNTILGKIHESNTSIKICVAWFTNKALMGSLVEKIKTGCSVELIISDDVINRKLPTKDFLNAGGLLKILPKASGRFLHEKFAIFDNNTVISGSYNWTYFAEYRNHESIILCYDKTIVSQYSIRFSNLNKLVEAYAESKLENSDNKVDAEKEAQLENLEMELKNEFYNSIKEAFKIGATLDTDYIIRFIETYGAIGGATKLISEGIEKLQSGLIKLWKINRLDLSFEHTILKEKYRFLFDDEILAMASARLEKLKKK